MEVVKMERISHLSWDDVIFVCIGTDRSTGDSLGPIVGTKLKELGYNVLGELDNTVNATNLVDVLPKIPQDKVVIAVDACLGQTSSVGKVKFLDGPVYPGAGVGKDLPPVGDYHFTGIVNIGGFMEYFVLQNTKLSLIMGLADEIVDQIRKNLPIIKQKRYYAEPNLRISVDRWVSKNISGVV
jgi:putative sporulation protein YyaC